MFSWIKKKINDYISQLDLIDSGGKKGKYASNIIKGKGKDEDIFKSELMYEGYLKDKDKSKSKNQNVYIYHILFIGLMLLSRISGWL